MRVLKVAGVGTGYPYKWGDGSVETYDYFVDYVAVGEDGEHQVRIGFGNRNVYRRDRVRIVVWIDGYPHAEFFGADDFDKSGEVLSVIKKGRKNCRYSSEAIPERYTLFNVVGLRLRTKAKGVHDVWAVVANIADHKTLVTLAGLRRLEK